MVLVRARNPQNIGAVARAMHDFGFGDLRVVNEFAVPFEAARSAIDASAVLAAATQYGDVAAAVADCTLVVGTTAVGERALAHPLRALRDAAGMIRGAAAGGMDEAAGARVALLFGSEKTGLSNEELSFCHWLLTIPMQQHAELRHPSMNLGQAVAVCLYELVRDGSAAVDARVGEAAAAREVERLRELLTEVLEQTEYTRRHPANSGAEEVRRLVMRMGVSAVDAQVWMGVLRQVLWKLRRAAGGE